MRHCRITRVKLSHAVRTPAQGREELERDGGPPPPPPPPPRSSTPERCSSAKASTPRRQWPMTPR
jgi:hypothetical protein